MINNDRIVPIQKIDYLSMIGTMLTIAGDEAEVLTATDVEGNFSVTGSGEVGMKLANQPVKTLDFAEGVTQGAVWFVAAYDFEGITVAGETATFTEDSATIIPDGITLYAAILDDGGSGTKTINIIRKTPSIA